MEKISKNKFIIGVIIFYALLIYVGGMMTRNMNMSSTVDNVIENINK